MEGASSERRAEGGATAPWTAECTSAVADGRQLHLEIYARALEPAYGTRAFHDRVNELVDTLEADGVIAGHEFDVWGDRLRIRRGSAVDGGHSETLADFRAWARERGVRLPFQVRECHSSILGEEYAVLVPPHVLVAVRASGELLGVAPCRVEDRSVSVTELLTLLCDPDRWADHPASVTS